MSRHRILKPVYSHDNAKNKRHTIRIEYGNGEFTWRTTIGAFKKFKRSHPEAKIVPRIYNR